MRLWAPAVFWLLILFGPCAVADDQVSGVRLVYEEDTGDGIPITTRVFVTPEYVHISDSLSDQGFILFDRRDRTIYNVTPSDRTIFVIKHKPVNIEPPLPINFQEELQASTDYPKLAGHDVRHYRYFTSAGHCYDAIVFADDFLSQATTAMYEFSQVLAGEHAVTVNTIPESMLDACDLARNVFHVGEYYKHGALLREWTQTGYVRYLKNFQTDASLPRSAFTLPAGYERYSISDDTSKRETNN